MPVVPIPGAAAFLAALVASGLPTDSFRFSGFLPAKRGQRRQVSESIKDSPRTQVFYEAPHRITEAVEDIVEVLGAERHIVLAREVTKIHEEFLRGRATDVLIVLKSRQEIKGEITLLIGKGEEGVAAELCSAGRGIAPSSHIQPIHERLKQIIKEEQLDEKAALKKVAKERGISKSEAYREWQRNK